MGVAGRRCSSIPGVAIYTPRPATPSDVMADSVSDRNRPFAGERYLRHTSPVGLSVIHALTRRSVPCQEVLGRGPAAGVRSHTRQRLVVLQVALRCPPVASSQRHGPVDCSSTRSRRPRVPRLKRRRATHLRVGDDPRTRAPTGEPSVSDR